MELLAVAITRALQALMASMPTLLAGMLVAGFVTVLVGHERVRSTLSRRRWTDLPAAVLAGILLPVSSMGVLPVLVMLATMRVRARSIVLIALLGPLVTPWTLGYVADRVGWFGLLGLVGASTLLGTVVGWVVEKRSPDPDSFAPSSRALGRSGLLASLASAGRSAGASVWLAVLLGVAGAGAAASLIPPNAVGDWLVDRTWANAVRVHLLSLLTVLTPDAAAMQTREAIESSAMPGLVISLIVVGVSTHLGTAYLLARVSGVRVLALGVPVLIGLSGLMALGADAVLHKPGVEVEDSHAFEDLGTPFQFLDRPEGPAEAARQRLAHVVTRDHAIAGGAVLALVVFGRLRRSSESPVMLGPGSLRGLVVSATVGTCIATVYTYVPSPRLIDLELRRMEADLDAAVLARDFDTAERVALEMDRRLGQLRFSRAVRFDPLDSQQVTSVREARVILAKLSSDHDARALHRALRAIRD
jgi:uncharacterized membrane protein YraQ (UPF0718 family)